MDRFVRQRMLSEIGDDGQRTLERTRLAPARGAAGLVRDLYLLRAGVECDSELPAVAPEPLDVPSELAHAAAVLQGAFLAVEQIKGALDVGRPGALSARALGGTRSDG